MSMNLPKHKVSASFDTILRSIEVREFAWLRPDTSLTPVYHYRTVYGEDGAVRRDILSADTLLQHIVRTFDGHVERMDEKQLHAHFEHPEQAQACAEAIELHHAREVDINGTQLIVSV